MSATSSTDRAVVDPVSCPDLVLATRGWLHATTTQFLGAVRGPINVGLFDCVGIRCKTHSEFEVADSALAMHKDTEATRWEAALRSAKDRAKATQETWPRITTYDFR